MHQSYIQDGHIYDKLGNPTHFINGKYIYDISTGDYIYFINEKFIVSVDSGNPLYYIDNKWIYRL